MLRELFAGAEMIGCSFCGAFIVVEHGHLKLGGKGAKLQVLPTPFAVGQEVVWKGARYTIEGRARYAYEDGLWDEWEWVGEQGAVVLQEDEGEWLAWTAVEDLPPTPLTSARLGSTVAGVRVNELGRADLVGLEGAVRRARAPREAFDYVDGAFSGAYGSVRTYPDHTRRLTGVPVSRGELTWSRK